MKRVLFLTLLLKLVFTFSQGFDNYVNIESTGALPKDFLLHSSDKYESSIDAEISSEDKRNVKKAKKSFLLMSSFELRDLLYSGKVAFNDTLSRYVDQVAQKVLAHDLSIKDDIRFYVLKSSAVNGFATNDGMIFITMGLISQIENEAQLAYVMSHEIAHYKKKHVINKYVENTKLQKQSYGSRQDLLIKRNKYSKELETEADIEGFKLFSKTSYKKKGVERIFDVLKYSYLPYDEIPFDTTIFQNEHYQFPESYWVDELNEVAIDEEYDEEKSSHPSPDERKKKISKLIADNENSEMGDYYEVKDEEYFKYMRNIARFEIAKILLTEHQYKKAIYHTYLLQREFKNNKYLDEIMTFAFYYLFRTDMSSSYSLTTDGYTDYAYASDIEGESHMVFYWLEEMSTKELGVLALKIALENKLKYTGDETFNDISFDLMYLLSREYELGYDSFKKSFPEPVSEQEIEEVIVVEEEVDENLSKLDRIQKKSVEQEEEILETEEYYKYAMVEVFANDKSIEELYDKAKEIASNTISEYDNRRGLDKKERRELRRKGHAFDIDKMVVVSPQYNKINMKKRQPIEYGASEDALLDLNKEILDAADNTGLDVEVLDDLTLKSADIQKYNDFIALNSWLIQSSRFLEKADTSFLVFLDNQRIDDISRRYNTEHFCWTGFTGVREKKSGVGAMLLLTSVYVVSLPYGIYYAVTPKYSMYYYSIVFDLKNKKAVWGISEDFSNRDSGTVIKSILYDTFYQLKRKSK